VLGALFSSAYPVVGRRPWQKEALLFLKKKKQKDFAPWRAQGGCQRANGQKFFASFFQKRSSYFPPLGGRPGV